MSLTIKEMERLVEAALERLEGAVSELEATAPTRAIETPRVVPRVPPPRPRMFDLAPGVIWPAFDRNGKVNWSCVQVTDGVRSLYHSGRTISDIIVHSCGYQPRKVLRAIRRIEAAAAWCDARVEGLKREAEEIVRQQARAAEQLETMVALQALAGDKS